MMARPSGLGWHLRPTMKYTGWGSSSCLNLTIFAEQLETRNTYGSTPCDYGRTCLAT